MTNPKLETPLTQATRSDLMELVHNYAGDDRLDEFDQALEAHEKAVREASWHRFVENNLFYPNRTLVYRTEVRLAITGTEESHEQ